MRSTLGAVAIGAALVVGGLAVRVSGSTGPIPLDCNRACLEGVIDQYLAAAVAHDPKRLPLSKDVSSELNRLLETGIYLGVATGRGKSVRSSLQAALPKRFWSRVVVGYYNGGDVAMLNEKTTSNRVTGKRITTVYLQITAT